MARRIISYLPVLLKTSKHLYRWWEEPREELCAWARMQCATKRAEWQKWWNSSIFPEAPEAISLLWFFFSSFSNPSSGNWVGALEAWAKFTAPGSRDLPSAALLFAFFEWINFEKLLQTWPTDYKLETGKNPGQRWRVHLNPNLKAVYMQTFPHYISQCKNVYPLFLWNHFTSPTCHSSQLQSFMWGQCAQNFRRKKKTRIFILGQLNPNWNFVCFELSKPLICWSPAKH